MVKGRLGAEAKKDIRINYVNKRKGFKAIPDRIERGTRDLHRYYERQKVIKARQDEQAVYQRMEEELEEQALDRGQIWNPDDRVRILKRKAEKTTDPVKKAKILDRVEEEEKETIAMKARAIEIAHEHGWWPLNERERAYIKITSSPYFAEWATYATEPEQKQYAYDLVKKAFGQPRLSIGQFVEQVSMEELREMIYEAAGMTEEDINVALPARSTDVMDISDEDAMRAVEEFEQAQRDRENNERISMDREDRRQDEYVAKAYEMQGKKPVASMRKLAASRRRVLGGDKTIETIKEVNERADMGYEDRDIRGPTKRELREADEMAGEDYDISGRTMREEREALAMGDEDVNIPESKSQSNPVREMDRRRRPIRRPPLRSTSSRIRSAIRERHRDNAAYSAGWQQRVRPERGRRRDETAVVEYNPMRSRFIAPRPLPQISRLWIPGSAHDERPRYYEAGRFKGGTAKFTYHHGVAREAYRDAVKTMLSKAGAMTEHPNFFRQMESLDLFGTPESVHWKRLYYKMRKSFKARGLKVPKIVKS